MRKRVSLKTRRPDLSVEVFRAHYEYRHIPLGLAHVDAFQWLKYVRNYIAAPIEGAPWFDCVTEFWTADDYDDALLHAFVKSDAFRPLDEDDPHFLDISKRFALDLDTETLIGAPAPEEAAKSMLLWRSGGGDMRAAQDAVWPVLEGLQTQTLHATLDVSRRPSADSAPFDSILTLWTKAPLIAADFEGKGPTGQRYIASIDSVETPRSLLYPRALH